MNLIEVSRRMLTIAHAPQGLPSPAGELGPNVNFSAPDFSVGLGADFVDEKVLTDVSLAPTAEFETEPLSVDFIASDVAFGGLNVQRISSIEANDEPAQPEPTPSPHGVPRHPRTLPARRGDGHPQRYTAPRPGERRRVRPETDEMSFVTEGAARPSTAPNHTPPSEDHPDRRDRSYPTEPHEQPARPVRTDPDDPHPSR